LVVPISDVFDIIGLLTISLRENIRI